MLEIARQTVRESRRSLLWWTLGILFFIGLEVGFYPSLRDSAAALQEVVDRAGAAIKLFAGNNDFASPEGFLYSRVFYLIVPMILIIYGVIAGSAAIAGEEGKRTLPLLLATPLSRSRAYLQRFVSILLTLLMLTIVAFLGLWIMALIVDLPIGIDKLIGTFTSLYLVSVLFASVALAVGAWRGTRGSAGAIAAVLAIGAYILNSLGTISQNLLEASKFSPFYQYIGYDPLRYGLQGDHAGILLGLIVIVVTIGWIGFRRRDLHV